MKQPISWNSNFLWEKVTNAFERKFCLAVRTNQSSVLHISVESEARICKKPCCLPQVWPVCWCCEVYALWQNILKTGLVTHCYGQSSLFIFGCGPSHWAMQVNVSSWNSNLLRTAHCDGETYFDIKYTFSGITSIVNTEELLCWDLYRQGCHTFLHLTLGTLNFAETIELLLVNWLKTLAVCKNVKHLCSFVHPWQRKKKDTKK